MSLSLALDFPLVFFFLQLLLHLLFLLLGQLFSFAGVVFIYFPHILSSRLLLVILVFFWLSWPTRAADQLAFDLDRLKPLSKLRPLAPLERQVFLCRVSA